MRPSPVMFAAAVGLLAATLTIATTPPARPAHLAAATEYRLGARHSENRPVTGSFHAVASASSINVVVTQGATASITVTGSAADVAATLTSIADGQLLIGTRRGSHSYSSDVTVTIVAPALDEISLQGSGDVELRGPFTGTTLTARLQGSGNLKAPALRLSGAMTTRLQGSGDVELGGTCASHEVQLQGSGDVKAEALRATDVSVKLRGSGDARVYAGKSLAAAIVGSGDVRYAGSPTSVTKDVTGSGSVSKL